MVDQWLAENKFIEDKIAQHISDIGTYFVKVVKTDGYYVDVMPFTVEKGAEKMENIPIMQTKYFSPIVQEEDVGLILNIKLDLSNLLTGNVAKGANRQNYYIFMPFNLNAMFQSTPEKLEMKSASLNDSISLTDEMIEIKTSKSLYVGSNETNVLNEISEYLNELKGFFDKFMQAAPKLAIQPGPGSAEMQAASQQMSQTTQQVYDKISEIVKGE